MGKVTATRDEHQSSLLYVEKARQMKALADQAADPASRHQFILLARSYEVLAARSGLSPAAALAHDLIAPEALG
jgi:hypothetical protein